MLFYLLIITGRTWSKIAPCQNVDFRWQIDFFVLTFWQDRKTLAEFGKKLFLIHGWNILNILRRVKLKITFPVFSSIAKWWKTAPSTTNAAKIFVFWPGMFFFVFKVEFVNANFFLRVAKINLTDCGRWAKVVFHALILADYFALCNYKVARFESFSLICP